MTIGKLTLNGLMTSDEELSTAISSSTNELKVDIKTIDNQIKTVVQPQSIDNSISSEYLLSSFLKPDGQISFWKNGGIVTNKINVLSDDVVLIHGHGYDQYTRAACFYDDNDNLVSSVIHDLVQKNTPAIVNVSDMNLSSGYVRGSYAYRDEIEKTYVLKTKRIVEDIQIIDGEYLGTKGEINVNASSHHTNLIPIDQNTIFKVSLRQLFSTPAAWCIYDERKKLIFSEQLRNIKYRKSIDDPVYLNDQILTGVELLKGNPFGKYIAFSSYADQLKVEVVTRNFNISTVIDEISANSRLTDMMYAKKWIACGDSFTIADKYAKEGSWAEYVDENGNKGIHSNAYDNKYQQYKTYPVLIANSHNMDLCLSAQSGKKMYVNSPDISALSNTFSYQIGNLSNEISSADYITFQFGLNDGKSNIGTKDDTDISSMWGAYNTVLSSVLTWNPGIKIGIIVSDGWLFKEYHDALIEVAKWWGVPYIDLMCGDNVPVQLVHSGITDYGNRNPFALQQRRSVFTQSNANNHPNVRGHRYRATVIDRFMQTL